jgi:hypothetical protein
MALIAVKVIQNMFNDSLSVINVSLMMSWLVIIILNLFINRLISSQMLIYPITEFRVVM